MLPSPIADRRLTLGLVGLAVTVVLFQMIRPAVTFVHPDAPEFMRVAWLMAQGKRPFIDFFQNHSPFYLAWLGCLFDPNAPLYPVWLTLSQQALLLVANAIFAVTLARALPTPTPTARRHLALAVFVIAAALSAGLRTHPIRPENPALLFLVLGWATCASRRWPLLLVSMACLGMAVLLSPRALPDAAIVMVWGMWPDLTWRRICRQILCGGIAAAGLLWAQSALLPFDQFHHWMIELNTTIPVAHSLPLSPMALNGKGERVFFPPFHFEVMACLCVGGAGMLLAWARRHRQWSRNTVCPPLAIIVGSLWTLMDRGWADYSFDFVYQAGLIQAGAGLHWLLRARAAGWPQARPALTAAFAGALAFATPPDRDVILAWPHHREMITYLRDLVHDVTQGPPPARMVLLQETNFYWWPWKMPVYWLRWNRAQCTLLRGETLFTWFTYPYCLDIASYHWVYLRHILDADLRQRPWMPRIDFAADFARTRPALVRVVTPAQPELAQEILKGIPARGYHRLGSYFIRDDIAVPFVLSPPAEAILR